MAGLLLESDSDSDYISILTREITQIISLFLLRFFRFLSVTAIIAGIIHLIKKRWARGFTVSLTTILFIVICRYFLIIAFFFYAITQPENDHFADNLSLPPGIQLAEPLSEGSPVYYHSFAETNSHYFGSTNVNDLIKQYDRDQDYRNAPTNSFQYQVLNAIGHGPTLDENADCSIPSLENLSTSEGSAKLREYLTINPEWLFADTERDGAYATRIFTLNNKENITLHSYYDFQNSFDETDSYSYRLGISLEGKSWYGKNVVGKQKISIKKEGPVYNTITSIRAGRYLVENFDKSQFPGRQMTAKTIELLEKEFAALAAGNDSWRNNLPKGMVISDNKQKTDIILKNGMQGGIYKAKIWANPGEPGTIYLKAFEITQGTQLSSYRLKERTSKRIGYSKDPGEVFPVNMEFTIYEGNWGQYYGARFELWFTPDSGAPERKLFEKNYKIQGWMR